MTSVFDKVENIVGKGENTGFQDLLLFPQYFQKTSFSGSGLRGRVKAPFMTITAFVALVDIDQAAQNVQPDL